MQDCRELDFRVGAKPHYLTKKQATSEINGRNNFQWYEELNWRLEIAKKYF